MRIDFEREGMEELLTPPLSSGMCQIFNRRDGDIKAICSSYASLFVGAITITIGKAVI